LVGVFSGVLDFLFAGTALVADADDGEEEDSSTTAEAVENVVVDGFDVVAGGSSLGFLLILWGCEHVGDLDFLVLTNAFNVGVGNLLIKFSSLFWFEFSFKPVLESEVGLHVLVGVGDDHDAALDSHGVGLTDGGLVVASDHALSSFMSGFSTIKEDIHLSFL